MPRQPRIEYEGAIYHVTNRGAHGEEIVREDTDRELWIKTLAEACAKCDWQVLAYCLMSDHFHLVVETPLGNLVSGMKWLLGTYTMRFHARHRLRGHLFAGRYKAVLMDKSDGFGLRVACDYVHLNPARAGLVSAEQPLSAYAWSSYCDYLQRGRARPRWLRTDRLLGEQGVRRDDRRLRLEFSRRMEARRLEVDQPRVIDELRRRARRMGRETFLARRLDRLDGELTENHPALERGDTAEMKAERIIRSRLEEIGWSETDLHERGKCAPEKIRIAQQLRAETTLSLKRVAERLSMGTWTNVSSLLYKVTKHDHKD